MKNENKTNKLYFLAMGMDYNPQKDTEMIGSDVLNYRIRTTFHDKDNNVIFIEVSRGYEYDKKMKINNRIKLHIDHLFNKTLSEDENESHIKPIDEYIGNYTRADILTFINLQFGTNYEEMEVISHLSQFDYKKTTGDKFVLDVEKLAQVNKIDNYFYNVEKEQGKKYPNHSIYWENDILKVLLHYNCYNDIVEIKDVYKFDFDYKAPSKEFLDLQAAKYR